MRGLNKIILCLLLSLGAEQMAAALPWDTDMYRQQSLQANEVARSPVPGTVPIGRKPFTLTVEQAESALKNPLPFDFANVWRGQRLWNANCSACHGLNGAGDGAVSKQFTGIPNILDNLYKNRSDGRYFAVITIGQGSMPRYGYKFSDIEKWSMIHYLRFLQGKDVAGLERPAK